MTDYILQQKSDRGLIREKNEDSCLVSIHPDNENIKLLAVADGMGGARYGDKASNYVITSLGHWFYEKDPQLLNDTYAVSGFLKKYIQQMNDELISMYGENCLGTTLTLALVNESQTIILNIGDSRCYLYKDKNLVQVTEDDSEVWYYYRNGQIRKEDLRYFSTSNLINACIGLNKTLCNCNIKTIENNNYDLLLLVTDGVTDLLTDDKIKFLINNTRKEELVDNLIKEAVYVDQDLYVPLELKRNYIEPFIIPRRGKDNASACVFIKR